MNSYHGQRNHRFRNGIKMGHTSNNSILKMFKTDHKTVKMKNQIKRNKDYEQAIHKTHSFITL